MRDSKHRAKNRSHGVWWAGMPKAAPAEQPLLAPASLVELLPAFEELPLSVVDDTGCAATTGFTIGSPMIVQDIITSANGDCWCA